MDSRRCCDTSGCGIQSSSIGILVLRRRRRQALGAENSLQDKARLHGDDIKPKEVAENATLEMESRAAPVEMDARYVGAELHARALRVE